VTFDTARFYRPADVWRLSRAPRAYVYASLRDGSLPAIRRGVRYLVPGSSVLAWIRVDERERQESA
jgi:hypothetical protein